MKPEESIEMTAFKIVRKATIIAVCLAIPSILVLGHFANMAWRDTALCIMLGLIAMPPAAGFLFLFIIMSETANRPK